MKKVLAILLVALSLATPVYACKDKDEWVDKVVYVRSGEWTTAGTYAEKTGTGFVIEGGLIVTNAHIVEGGEYTNIRLRTTNGYLPIISCEVIALDVDKDLALLEPAIDLSDRPYFEFDFSTTPDTDYTIIGHPLDKKWVTVTGKYNGDVDISRLIQNGWSKDEIVRTTSFNVSIQRGNSGSPIIDEDGEVVSIISAVDPINAVGYGVMAQDIKSFLEGYDDAD